MQYAPIVHGAGGSPTCAVWGHDFVRCRFYLRRNLGDAPWEQVGTGMAKGVGVGSTLPPWRMRHAVRALCTCLPCA